MQKELNSELFGEISVTRTRNVSESSSPSPGWAALAKEFDGKIAGLRAESRELFENLSQFANQVNEALKNHQSRIQGLSSQVQVLEKNDSEIISEQNLRLKILHNKLSEREAVDRKVQEMIDRHNSVLRSYEVRLNHLQRLIAEREEQVVKATSALTEAKAEIARMKRL